MPESELAKANPLVSKKNILIGLAIGSLLMTVGFLSKSGVFSKAKTAIVGWWTAMGRETYRAADFVPASTTPAVNDSFARLRQFPLDERPPAVFRGLQKTVTVELKADEWSREITVPDRKLWWRLEVDPTDGYYMLFADSQIVERLPTDTSERDLSSYRLPFRLLGKKPNQTAKVEIFTKPPK